MSVGVTMRRFYTFLCILSIKISKNYSPFRSATADQGLDHFRHMLLIGVKGMAVGISCARAQGSREYIDEYPRGATYLYN